MNLHLTDLLRTATEMSDPLEEVCYPSHLEHGELGPYEKFCIGNNSGIRTFHLVTSFSDYPIKWSPTNFKHVLLLQNILTLSAFSCCPDWSPPMLMVVMLRCPLGAIICTFDLTINSFSKKCPSKLARRKTKICL